MLARLGRVAPDGLYDRVRYTYNRQGERTAKTDQNGTVHEYTYDSRGRQTAVRITTLGTGVDGSVRRIATTYEVRGMVESITSYASTGASGSSSSSSSSSGSPGDAANQVLFETNAWVSFLDPPYFTWRNWSVACSVHRSQAASQGSPNSHNWYCVPGIPKR